MFIVSVVQHIRIGDLSQAGVSLSGDDPGFNAMDVDDDRLPEGTEPGDTPRLSRSEERLLVRDSTASFVGEYFWSIINTNLTSFKIGSFPCFAVFLLFTRIFRKKVAKRILQAENRKKAYWSQSKACWTSYASTYPTNYSTSCSSWCTIMLPRTQSRIQFVPLASWYLVWHAPMLKKPSWNSCPIASLRLKRNWNMAPQVFALRHLMQQCLPTQHCIGVYFLNSSQSSIAFTYILRSCYSSRVSGIWWIYRKSIETAMKVRISLHSIVVETQGSNHPTVETLGWEDEVWTWLFQHWSIDYPNSEYHQYRLPHEFALHEHQWMGQS